MEKTHVVVSVQERLNSWCMAEEAAREAEAAIRALGQAAAHPHDYEQQALAEQLRTEADRLFGAIIRTVKAVDPAHQANPTSGS